MTNSTKQEASTEVKDNFRMRNPSAEAETIDDENDINDEDMTDGEYDSDDEHTIQAFTRKHPSDVTIIFGGRRLALHKSKLEYHSRYFEAMFNGAFKESDAREVELFDDDEESLVTVFEYVYGYDTVSYCSNFDVYAGSLVDGDPANLLEGLQKIYVVLDKYDMWRLREEMLGFAGALIECTDQRSPEWLSWLEFISSSVKPQQLCDVQYEVAHGVADALTSARSEQRQFRKRSIYCCSSTRS
ncbi:hypothetical protein K461DRAFT_278002 [Myriangium duriaei CBS 260.36]|uniref:BTB domain-containing protein n=1 Tax=Myriangium duriaei CBS 260.36 TaxID=1168546 RepID=A0A9P4MHG0_9PEZI|nr:hypothetical protein K461DRAFT_278002 [Myriangium duriaei CBS 260.36]